MIEIPIISEGKRSTLQLSANNGARIVYENNVLLGYGFDSLDDDITDIVLFDKHEIVHSALEDCLGDSKDLSSLTTKELRHIASFPHAQLLRLIWCMSEGAKPRAIQRNFTDFIKDFDTVDFKEYLSLVVEELRSGLLLRNNSDNELTEQAEKVSNLTGLKIQALFKSMGYPLEEVNAMSMSELVDVAKVETDIKKEQLENSKK